MSTGGIGQPRLPGCHPVNVNPHLRCLLDEAGVVRRRDVLELVPSHVLDHALRSGLLRRVAPELFVDADVRLTRTQLVDAALRYADGVAALSHTTALAAWRLPAPGDGPVHLTTAPTVRLRGTAEIRVHRRDGFEPVRPHVVVRAGRPVTRLEITIVDSWPMLDKDAKRAPAILAVARRLTTPDRLRAALDQRPRLAGRRNLALLIDKLAAGCRSELELWGYDRVFSDLGPLRWQVPVRVPYGTVYLDVYDERTSTNFELDGAKHHAGPADRERDLRRDAALAEQGITVVRFTHDRLTEMPLEVREQIRAILRTRRA